MSIELDDYQFELLSGGGLNAPADAAWGIGLPIATDGDGFDTGSVSWVTQDQRGPRSDHTSFGVDFIDGGKVWSWVAHTDLAQYPDEGLAAITALEHAWKHHPARRRIGAVAALRYRLAGRNRRVYGRPRDFSAPLDNRILHGMIPLTFGFKCAEDVTYDDVALTRTIRSVADDPGGGLISPLTYYTSATFSGPVQSDPVNTSGNLPAPFSVRFDGPGVNPWIRQDDWIIQLDHALADDESVTVKTYPWDMNAVSSFGGSVALKRTVRLSKARLRIGAPLSYGGGDLSGNARCTVAWRPAWSTI